MFGRNLHLHARPLSEQSVPWIHRIYKALSTTASRACLLNYHQRTNGAAVHTPCMSLMTVGEDSLWAANERPKIVRLWRDREKDALYALSRISWIIVPMLKVASGPFQIRMQEGEPWSSVISQAGLSFDAREVHRGHP